VVGGVGLASLGAALYFWIAGDPPGRYDGLPRESKAASAWRILPGAGSGDLGASVRVRF
jgi:hypothetical protein